MSEKGYKEITGTILSCSIGYNAVIKTEDGELVTSPVVAINMVWDNKFFFETQNTRYVVKGAILTAKKNDDELQEVYNKIMTILINSGVTLDLTHAIPVLKRDSEIRSFNDCEDWFRPCKSVLV